VIYVAQCFDAGFTRHAAVGVTSALKNATSDIHFYWVIPKQDINEVLATLEKVPDFEGHVTTISVDSSMFSDWKTLPKINQNMYLRLLLPDILVDLDRVIYMDSDILVVGDLGELYSMDLGDTVLAGTYDWLSVSKHNIGTIPFDLYINSGVLLMDLNKLRRIHMLDKIKEIYEAESINIWGDQCLINRFSEGIKSELDPKWNQLVMLSDMDDIPYVEDARVYHFISLVKPWLPTSPAHITELWNSYIPKGLS